ncbi:substrate-binding periplasmic protein [Paraglaciecola sp.]|uniref:substrate-binding periplasmic protein n=1 Tax=Paraglaciecola sp. TaxID=1920173 RepID=UPI003EF4C125
MGTRQSLIGFACFVICNVCLAKEQIKFAVNSPGAKPYFYTDRQSTQYKGLIVDLLFKVSSEFNMGIQYVDSDKNRAEYLLHMGEVDAIMSSSAWLKGPDKLLASVPILKHRDYFYQLSPFSQHFKIEDLEQSLICTRKDFVYTSVHRQFLLRKLQRVDVSKQKLMFDMLINKRCNLALLGEFKANELMDLGKYKDTTIYRSPYPVESAEIKIFLSPKLAHIKSAIDKVITKMRNENFMQSLILKHSKMR